MCVRVLVFVHVGERERVTEREEMKEKERLDVRDGDQWRVCVRVSFCVDGCPKKIIKPIHIYIHVYKYI